MNIGTTGASVRSANTASDRIALLDTAEASVTINDALAIIPPVATVAVGNAVSFSAAGGVPPYLWRVIEGELPLGMSLSLSGKLSGRPFEGISLDETKDCPFTVEVRDQRGETATRLL